jgi:serine/threonine protein kinase
MLSRLTGTKKIRSGLVFDILRATDPAAGRTVAVKMLKQSSAGNPRHQKYLKNEWKAIQRLQHRNIIAYFHHGRSEGMPYMVMEWIEGTNLKSFAEKNIPDGMNNIPHAKRYKLRTMMESIIAQMVDAVCYIHNRNVIHLDIKPENFLLTEDTVIKLIDFSNARTGFWARRQKNTSIDGTPSFISPEQIRKEKPDETSDIYSLGASIYYLLNGTPPYTGNSVDQILSGHLKTRHIPLLKCVPDIRREFSHIVDSMLAKKRSERLQNLSTLKHEIQKKGIFPKLS